MDAFDTASLEALLRPLAEELGLKTGQLFGTLRIAVTGREVAPPLFQTMAALGKERCLERIKAALKKLEEWGGRYEFTHDATGLKIVKEKGARYLGLTPQMEDPEKRIADMDRLGLDIQVLTLSTPNVYFSTKKEKPLPRQDDQ
jgi:hypothetical protein